MADSPASRFKQGDVVFLKSGGPDMTVADINPEGLIVCDWFDDTRLCRTTFPAACLEIADEADDMEILNRLRDIALAQTRAGGNG